MKNGGKKGKLPCSWIRRIKIMKMSLVPNGIYRFNFIHIKLPMAFFIELVQKTSQVHMETQRIPLIVKTALRKMELEESNFLTSGFPTKLQSSRWYGTDTKVDQWNKIEINPCTYGYLIFYKGGKNIQWGKDSLFNKWFWEKWTATCKRMKLE